MGVIKGGDHDFQGGTICTARPNGLSGITYNISGVGAFLFTPMSPRNTPTPDTIYREANTRQKGRAISDPAFDASHEI
jgi:hypothetical protein